MTLPFIPSCNHSVTVFCLAFSLFSLAFLIALRISSFVIFPITLFLLIMFVYLCCVALGCSRRKFNAAISSKVQILHFGAVIILSVQNGFKHHAQQKRLQSHCFMTGSAINMPSRRVSINSFSIRAVFIRVILEWEPKLYSSLILALPKSS